MSKTLMLCQRGDVLMEYVILLVCIIPFLIGAQLAFDVSGNGGSGGALFNPAGDYKGDFGLVGNAYHQHYTNLVTGISLPTP